MPTSDLLRIAIREALAEELDARGLRASSSLPRLLTRQQASKCLGISERYLRELIDRGEFQTIRLTVGGIHKIDLRDIEAFIAAHKDNGAAA